MAEIFPTITGKNLNKQVTAIPDDFSEQPLIVIAAFQRWHQNLVDESMENLDKMNMNDTHTVIELPVIKKSSMLQRMRLDGLMRAAISDFGVRQRTITVYLDKQAFRDSLNIPNEDTMYWFVVDHTTKSILLRGSGIMTPEDIRQIKTRTVA
ncbi:MAG: hypothetical protein OSA38_02160 [Candidatus Poseidoniaceae archaeon]|nr:hypothetical protein [Candidatus Poseidoniaceae archaeon]|tara:strand:+ start:553 stop:1008 length:456 start_codon:yes stop_codon:yes gene_type:complete